jgi:uncharacterized damage-inducible protein DinB
MIIQTPWVERKFEFNYPVGLFPVILERLRGTPYRLHGMLENIADEKLSWKFINKWSIKEIVGHLYDIEELWSARIDDFMQKKETLRAADMTNTKTQQADHNSKTMAQLLTQFALARTQLILKVENLDEQSAATTALHPRLQKQMRLVDSLFFAAEHDDHELTKIRWLLNA